MTQTVLVAHSYLTKAIELIYEAIAGFFKTWMKSIIAARQAEANLKIVPYLRSEYKGMSDSEILQILNAKIVEDLKK